MNKIIKKISFNELNVIKSKLFSNNIDLFNYLSNLREIKFKTSAILLLLSLLDNFEGKFNSAENNIVTAFKFDFNIMKMLFPSNDRNHYIRIKNNYKLDLVLNCPICDSNNKRSINVSLCVNHNGYNNNFSPYLCWANCLNCNHIFLEKVNDKSVTVDEEITKDFYQYIDFEKKKKLDYSAIEHLKSLVSGKKKVLEIGSGSGSMLSVLNDFDFDCLGIDNQAFSVDYCRKKGFKVIKTGFLEFDFEESFDALIMGDVIEHISDLNSVINKCSKILNESGLLWISTPIFDSDILIKKRNIGQDPYFSELEHVHYFTRSSLIYLLEKHGFKLINEKENPAYIGSVGFTFQKNLLK